MIDIELIKFAVLQLLVIAGSLDENLTSENQKVLKLTFSPKLVPSNLPALIADSQARLAGMSMPAATPTQSSSEQLPVPSLTHLSTDNQQLPASHGQAPTGHVVPQAIAPPPVHAPAPGSPPAAPVHVGAASVLSRRRRSIGQWDVLSGGYSV